jgi:hypothetical protein
MLQGPNVAVSSVGGSIVSLQPVAAPFSASEMSFAICVGVAGGGQESDRRSVRSNDRMGDVLTIGLYAVRGSPQTPSVYSARRGFESLSRPMI